MATKELDVRVWQEPCEECGAQALQTCKSEGTVYRVSWIGAWHRSRIDAALANARPRKSSDD